MKRKLIVTLLVLAILLITTSLLAADMERRYESSLSKIMYDRHGVPVSIESNQKGHIVLPATEIPEEFITRLITKEDRRFYYHIGTDPISIGRIMWTKLTTGEAAGGSTLHEQLAKNLLGNENKRTLKNKSVEILYAISLKLFVSNDDVLRMYTNSVYLGNQVQGFETASQAYFGKPLKETSYSEQISLLATLSHPSTRNPWADEHERYAAALSEKINRGEYRLPQIADTYAFQNDAAFELRTAGVTCTETCTLTVDAAMTATIRSILARHIAQESYRNVHNGAVAVLHAETGELLALVGSPDPNQTTNGAQINMAVAPRPIGSTVKPFLYLSGFLNGLRPYTLVEDREYRYPIATGFSLYPKNFDGQYYGIITLHEALSNSLNVPSVKVLEYVGLETFYNFLDQTLAFDPIQPYDNYQYGIALGGLEMDLLTLTHYFSLFPRQGTLEPIDIILSEVDAHDLPHQSHIQKATVVSKPEYTELVNAIISDRQTGVNQFSLKSNLNLTFPHYGVKTGTSRDFHDSWIVGYTNDLVVGVWLGNSENTALAEVTGQSGAGAVWHDVMEYLFTTEYHTKSPLMQSHITHVPIDNSLEWGLLGDDILHHQNILSEDTLILSLHNNDVFENTENLTIPLKAKRSVEWRVNGAVIETTKETILRPEAIGNYEIMATERESGDREILHITVVNPG